MTDMLTGKVALITGASRGIGSQIALLFAKEGCSVAFTYRKASAEAESLCAEIEAQGGVARAFQSDAASFADAERVVKEVVAAFGKLDILVNNAGITRDTLLLRMSEELWDEVMENNLKSCFNFMHAVAPQMMRQRSGSIISMSSVVGLAGNAGQANYAASKAGIVALTQSVAQELGPRGVRVNAIAPGFIHTDMTSALSDELRAGFEKQIPLRRGGEPEEVAKVALFLASDLASYVSGQVLRVDGAMRG